MIGFVMPYFGKPRGFAPMMALKSFRQKIVLESPTRRVDCHTIQSIAN